MLPDFHTHSMFSGDSEEKPENMIEFAIKNKMKYFCFTDHLDLDYPEDDVDFNLDVDSYYPYIYHLKELYSDKKCPKCNKLLLIKKGRNGHGDFLACSGFPKCRYIESIKK